MESKSGNFVKLNFVKLTKVSWNGILIVDFLENQNFSCCLKRHHVT